MFPIAVIKFYLSVTTSIKKSNEQTDNEYFAYQVSIAISYINSSGTFFIYTLRGKLFRIEIIRLFHRLLCWKQQNLVRQQVPHIARIHPIKRF